MICRSCRCKFDRSITETILPPLLLLEPLDILLGSLTGLS